MSTVTSIRIDHRLKADVERQAHDDGLSFSDVCRVLLKAYRDGDIEIDVRAKPLRGRV